MRKSNAVLSFLFEVVFGSLVAMLGGLIAMFLLAALLMYVENG